MLTAATLVALTSAAAHAADLKTVDRPIEGEYFVVLKESAARFGHETSRSRASVPALPAIARSMATKHRFKVKHSFQRALRGFVVKADDKALAQLLADPRVEYVEENGYAHGFATQNAPTWGLDRIDQRALPLSRSFTYDDSKGAGVHAYVVDSGLNASHSEFTNRVGNGADFVNDGRGTSDCLGHGTHVAGTLGGTTYGVAKGVILHPVRILDCNDDAPWSKSVAALDRIIGDDAKHGQPSVVNMSLGGRATVQSVLDAVKKTTDAGITVVVAAGNDGGLACDVTPAKASSAITVAASDALDRRSIYPNGSSNHGACVDIFAPGSNIMSADSKSDTAGRLDGGTSMASPHVAGVVALYLAKNPTATVAQVTSFLLSNATKDKVTDAKAGSPNLLLHSALSGGTTPPPPPPGPSGSNDTDVAITDNGAAVTSAITISGLSGTTSSTSSAYVKITHPWRGDLEIKLKAPDGTVGTLQAIVNANDDADNIDKSYVLPSNLQGKSKNGAWTLQVRDAAASDVGTLTFWSITL